MTSTTEKDRTARSFIDPVWVRRYAEYIEQKGCLYRHYRCNVYKELVPKLFVLYVPNCTVSKLHFGEPIFPLKNVLFLFRWTPTGGILKKRKKEMLIKTRDSTQKECQDLKITNTPIIYSK